jgi:tRNA modification GTPase
MKTIFSLASAPGRSGIAVFRLSGPAAGIVLERLTGQLSPPARVATRVKFCDPGTDDAIDHGLSLWFPGPDSYTGEDVAELHVHGGRAVCDAITGAVLAIPDVRLAEPGEFTRRAFEHGKMDLTEAEAVADLVDAETEAQRRQALRQMEGALGALYENWRERLIHSVAHMEAWIDFPDEDLPDDVIAGVRREIESLRAGIDRHLSDGWRGERLREGIHIAIIGNPNVGKSTLLNILAGRNAAIVSGQEGTTRDVIEIALDIGGYPVILADTAGLREGVGEVEQEGVRRALLRAETADLKIIMFDGQSVGDPAVAAAVSALVDGNSLVLFNKMDLGPTGSVDAPDCFAFLPVSLKTGENVAEMMDVLETLVTDRFDTGSNPTLTRARHRAALDDCLVALSRAGAGNSLELQAEDLRLAVRALGRITGRVDVEGLLDVIFGDFCIGK